ncbi:hypothetical protein [Nocardioides insulae]|uniref:hypothetical protein n=1 Tax=Nocardioides insulae TaxID=394734 RepID=UPI0004066FF3|nr:hypothetical protein [Nocardioides insulae]
MQVSRPWVVRAVVTASLVLTPVLTGCGTFSRTEPPTGVDQLTIPTPSPDPADFVATVDNPWLPLEQGRVSTYAVELPSGGHGVRTVSVQSGTERIAGVLTTVVLERLTGDAGGILDRAFYYYAQDRDGNVWWFGRRDADAEGAGAEAGSGNPPSPSTAPEDTWRAGEGGAQAGLVMAAGPRLGDGYRTAYLPGVLEPVATVTEVEKGRVELEIGPGGGEQEAPGSVGTEPGAVTSEVVTEVYELGLGLTRREEEPSGQIESLTSTLRR